MSKKDEEATAEDFEEEVCTCYDCYHLPSGAKSAHAGVWPRDLIAPAPGVSRRVRIE